MLQIKSAQKQGFPLPKNRTLVSEDQREGLLQLCIGGAGSPGDIANGDRFESGRHALREHWSQKTCTVPCHCAALPVVEIGAPGHLPMFDASRFFLSGLCLPPAQVPGSWISKELSNVLDQGRLMIFGDEASSLPPQ